MANVKDFKGFFFDSAKVLKLMAAAERRAQSKIGGYTRRVAKNSIKYSTKNKRVSDPGSPPLGHKSLFFKRKKKRKGVETKQPSSPLKELIFYGYDPDTNSTVIGPAIFRRSKSAGVAPARLEFGLDGYAARPLMAPALKKTSAKFPDAFKNSLR